MYETTTRPSDNDLPALLTAYSLGVLPEGLEIAQMFAQAGRNNNSSPTKAMAETYTDAVAEQERLGIEYVRLQDDPDLKDLPALLEGVFGKPLLDGSLVSRIAYYPDTVLIADNGHHYGIPPQDYTTLVAVYPGIVDHRVRAFSASNMNLHPAIRQYQRTPIAIYSFAGEPLADKEYLADVDEVTKQRLYKLGTVIHEVAHHVWNNVLTPMQREEWVKLNLKASPLTGYAQKYEGNPGWAEEQFSEAIRLRATSKDYLYEYWPTQADYIFRTLPQLHSIERSS